MTDERPTLGMARQMARGAQTPEELAAALTVAAKAAGLDLVAIRAAERKATVERIWAAIEKQRPMSVVELRAILDAELSASPETDSQAER